MIGIADRTKQPDEKVQGETPVPETRTVRNEEHTDTETPKMYSQGEVDALLGKAGGRIKAERDTVITERDAARRERDEAKKQVESLNTELSDTKTSIESLKKDMEVMAQDDPDRSAIRDLILQKEKDLRSLKDEKAALDGPRKEYEQWKRDQLGYSVADEFANPDGSDVDFDAFMAAANRLKANDGDSLTAVAETMGLKLKDETTPESEKPKPKAPKPYSGKSEGGSPYFTEEQVADYDFWEAHKEEIELARYEGRIRR